MSKFAASARATERNRERQRHTERDREKQRETETSGERQREAERDRETQRETERDIECSDHKFAKVVVMKRREISELDNFNSILIALDQGV